MTDDTTPSTQSITFTTSSSPYPGFFGTATLSPSPSSPAPAQSLSAGAKAGIETAAVIVGLAVIIGLSFFIARGRRRRPLRGTRASNPAEMATSVTDSTTLVISPIEHAGYRHHGSRDFEKNRAELASNDLPYVAHEIDGRARS